jgi:hypothetical protein
MGPTAMFFGIRAIAAGVPEERWTRVRFPPPVAPRPTLPLRGCGFSFAAFLMCSSEKGVSSNRSRRLGSSVTGSARPCEGELAVPFAPMAAQWRPTRLLRSPQPASTSRATRPIPARYTGRPIDLANMRANGVRSIYVWCLDCGHDATVNVSLQSITSFSPHMLMRLMDLGSSQHRLIASRREGH